MILSYILDILQELELFGPKQILNIYIKDKYSFIFTLNI